MTPAPAVAGGMVLPVRGVRSVERAGAFVAGADDADALWQNPAGLAHLTARSGKQTRALLFDAAYVAQSVDHERVDAAGVQPKVANDQPGQVIPTLAGALGIDDRFVIAGGIAAPYLPLHRYATDGPQRYASVGLDGSTFVIVTVGAGVRVSDRLRVGATLQDLVSTVKSRVVVSGCPDGTTCAPNDRSYDAALSIEQTDYVSPSFSIGAQYDASDAITLGLVVQGPQRIAGSGTLALELPSAPEFENATVVGDRGAIRFTLPPSLRVAVEWRPNPALRVEAALGAELWSMHDELELAPDAVAIDNVVGAGAPIALRAMTIPRDYETSYAPSIGVEWHGPKLMLGAGYAYETAAAPRGTVSVLTVDAAKHLVGIGGGYEDGGWQIGAALAYVAVADVDVALADSQVQQLAPLRDSPTGTVVNAGSYRSSDLVAGLRFARRW